MLTASQVQVICRESEDGDYICLDCADNSEAFTRAVIQYSADETFSPEGKDCDSCGRTIVPRDSLCAECAGEDCEDCIGNAGDKCDWCANTIAEEDEENDG